MSRKPTATKLECLPNREASPDEKQAIAEAQRRRARRSPRLRVMFRQSKTGAVEVLGGPHVDQSGWLDRLEDVFGTRGTAFAVSQLNRLMKACQNGENKIDGGQLDGMLAMIEGAAPQNEIQAALAVQMALTHAAAQTLLARALRVDQIPQFDSASNSAVKLLRTYALQAETLAKLQRGGEQVVKVVHVHSGAQAIVGNVLEHQINNGGGVDFENINQPHAKAEHPAISTQPLLQVWSEDAEREPVPLTRRER